VEILVSWIFLRVTPSLAGFRLFVTLFGMSTVAEIEAAIEKLPPTEQQQLREWFGQREQPRVSVYHKLRALAGTAKNLPEDLAANHDHYLHGTSKRS
jgi:hypothetical protein